MDNYLIQKIAKVVEQADSFQDVEGVEIAEEIADLKLAIGVTPHARIQWEPLLKEALTSQS